MDIISWIIIGLLGLCWGSFLNVLIARTISGESIIFPPSKCPKCRHTLYWWHNIPLLSFLILNGKCYFCNKSISIRYPIVELAGMGIVILSFSLYVSIVDAIAVSLILSLLLVLSFTDVQLKKISAIQTLVIILAGIIFNRHDVINSFTGGLVGAGFISAIILTGRYYLKKETFGIGDVLLFAGLGTLVGFEKLFLYILLLLIIQFIIILPGYIMRLIRENELETLKYLIIFGITCLFLYISKNITFWGSNIILALFLGIMLFSAYRLALNLTNSVKNTETVSYSPLAPAVAICCAIFLC